VPGIVLEIHTLTIKEPAAEPVSNSVMIDLDTDTAAIVSWLMSVCRRSERGFDQQFIYRGPSKFNRILLRKKKGEVKAIAMPDLISLPLPDFQKLKRLSLISLTRSRWPGVWFTLNRDTLFAGGLPSASTGAE
jgi:hypothetical protein